MTNCSSCGVEITDANNHKIAKYNKMCWSCACMNVTIETLSKVGNVLNIDEIEYERNGKVVAKVERDN